MLIFTLVSFILSIIYAFNNAWKSGFEAGWTGVEYMYLINFVRATSSDVFDFHFSLFAIYRPPIPSGLPHTSPFRIAYCLFHFPQYSWHRKISLYRNMCTVYTNTETFINAKQSTVKRKCLQLRWKWWRSIKNGKL